MLPWQYCKLCAIPSGKLICTTCIANLEPIQIHQVPHCDFIDKIYCQFKYAKPLSSVLHHYKYYKNKKLAWALGYLLFHILEQISVLDIDLIIPVPLHKNKHKERGFNQSLELLNYYRAFNNLIPIDSSSVSRIKDTIAQAKIGKVERQLNLVDAFTVDKDINGLRVLIIDDVLTTGATVNALAKILKQKGAIKVEVCCLMRA